MSIQIDREARRTAADLIDRYLGGMIDNFELDDRLSAIQTPDELCNKIIKQIWFLYDSSSRHRNEKARKLLDICERGVRRWVALLRSDQQWIWDDSTPKYAGYNPLQRILNRIAQACHENDLKLRENEYWPFRSESEWEIWMSGRSASP